MSSEFYPKSVSRNLIRISGSGYHENRSLPDAEKTITRTLKDYAGQTHIANGGYLPLSITVLPLHVHWLGQ